MMTQDHDDETRRILEDVKVPTLSNDFYTTLKDTLDDVTKQRATPITSMSSHTAHRSKSKPRKSFILSGIAAAACIAIAATVLITSPFHTTGKEKRSTTSAVGTNPVPSANEVTEFKPTLASQVIEKADAQYAKVNGVKGVAKITQYCAEYTKGDGTCKSAAAPAEATSTFRMTSNGDSYVETGAGKDRTVQLYNSKTAQYTLATKNEGRWQVTQNGSAPSPDISRYIGSFSFQSLLNGLSIDKNAALAATEVNGKKTWSIHAKGLPTDAFGNSPNEVKADFDATTLFPVKLEEFRNGQQWSITNVTELQVNPGFSENDFMYTPPAGAEVVKENNGTRAWKRAATIADVKSLVSYKPIEPRAIPDGFSLRAVYSTIDAGAGGPEGMNEYNRDVIIMFYSRGLQRFVFTTRLIGPKPDMWNDPHGYEGDQNSKRTTFKLVGGTYNNVNAELVTGFGITPHIWVKGATLLTTAAGDLTAEELTSVMQSTQTVD